MTSLFVVDYLLRPASYERELTVCGVCDAVTFDSDHYCHAPTKWRRMTLSKAARAWAVR